jgi:hypothetical protein
MVERSEEFRWVACGVLVVLACATGCGGDDSGGGGDGDAGGSTSSGGSMSSGGTSSGGTRANGGTSTGGASNGGTSTGGTSSGGSSSGAGGSGDCTGAFGTPRVVLEMAATSFSGLTVSPDELELIYSAGPTDGYDQGFFRATRASKADAFSNPVALPELDEACGVSSLTRSGDLTFDGLGFYFTCYDISAGAVAGELRYARRPSLDAPFVVERLDYLTVNGGPSVSRDELELFASFSSGPAKRYVRSDTSSSFSSGEDVAGLETYIVATPEIAPDGSTLYFSQSVSNTYYALVEATRSAPGAAFGPLNVLLPEIMNETFGSPAISNDCRSLYFVHYVFQSSVLTYRVEVMTR